MPSLNTSHHKERKRLKLACRQKRETAKRKKMAAGTGQSLSPQKRRPSRLEYLAVAPSYLIFYINHRRIIAGEFKILNVAESQPALASTRIRKKVGGEERERENRSSFPHKAQDKRNPI